VRVGLVIYGSLDVLSGGNLYDRMLVSSLKHSGHDVELVSIRNRSYALDLIRNFSPGLERQLTNGSFDVLVQDELIHPSLFRLNRALRGRFPIASIVHHLRSSEARPDWQNRLYRGIEKRYLLSIDAFVFNSETTRQTVESLLEKKTVSVVATPGGDRLGGRLTPLEVRARATEDGELRILFVGNLIGRKGLHHLLKALHSLGNRAYRLDVVGPEDADRAYAAGIRSQVRDLGLEGRVHFHGGLGGAALEERFRAAQVLAVPSSYEGFGIVYLEAMGFGLPVIASSAGATDEIVRHESTGFLVPPGDEWILARRIEALLEDRALLSMMSLAALEAFDDHPGWEESMNKVERFLLELTKRPSRTNMASVAAPKG
jgi:glycosyltransferase involved in cell wall biosynthesis